MDSSSSLVILAASASFWAELLVLPTGTVFCTSFAMFIFIYYQPKGVYTRPTLGATDVPFFRDGGHADEQRVQAAKSTASGCLEQRLSTQQPEGFELRLSTSAKRSKATSNESAIFPIGIQQNFTSINPERRNDDFNTLYTCQIQPCSLSNTQTFR